MKKGLLSFALISILIYLPLWGWTISESKNQVRINIQRGLTLPTLGSDSLEYVAMAKNVLAGNGFSLSQKAPFIPDTFRTPGYPLIIAFFYLLTGSLFSVTLFQIILTLLIALIIQKVVWKWTDNENAGLISGLIFMLNPTVIFNTLTIGNDIFFVFLLISTFYAFFVASPEKKYWAIALGGIAGGLAILTKPSGLYLIILLPVLYVILKLKSFGWKKTLVATLIVITTLVATLSPWLVRNKMSFGSWSISSVTGWYLYWVYVPRLISWTEKTDFAEVYKKYEAKNKISANDASKPEYSGKATAIAMRYIKERPIDNIKFYMMFIKPFMLPSELHELEDLNAWQYDNLYTGWLMREFPSGLKFSEKAFWALMWILAFYGLWRNKGKYKETIIAFLFIIFIFITTGPATVSRLRMHADPLILMLAGISISLFIPKTKNKFEQKIQSEAFLLTKPFDKILHAWRCSKIKKYIVPEMVVCDLGCGMQAPFLHKIEGKIKEGFGLDKVIDNDLITEKIKLIATDLNNPLPLNSHMADLVFSMAVVEHLYKYEEFVNETFRILKNDGVAVFSTPSRFISPILKFLSFFNLVDRHEASDHKIYFNKKSLTDMFKRAGFKSIEVKYFQFGLNQLIVAKK